MLIPTRRPRLSSSAAVASAGKFDDEYLQPLLPCLPDDLSQLCLSLISPSLLFSVCRSWRRLLYSPFFTPFLSLYALLSKKAPNDTDDNDDDQIGLYCFDPIAGSWTQLPPAPPNPPLRRLLIHHPYFISRSLPIQSVATADYLILLAASTDHLQPALPRPLAFHPVSRSWLLGPPLSHPRRWCATGSAAGTVYLASGVGSAYRSDVARSAERWDPTGGSWEQIASLRDGRFSREAVDAVATGGKLWMVNVRGRGLKQGMVYDIKRDRWEEMPPGMLAGWTGPAVAPPWEVQIYVVDELSGELRAYKWGEDRWRVVLAATEGRRGSVAVAAAKGKVCVAVDGGSAVEVVDVRRPEKTWAVDLPAGRRVMALHVLPRMSEK